MDKNVPDHPGLYWAKTGTYKWFNVIAVISNDPPFMSVVFYDSVSLGVTDRKYSLSDVTEWGPEILRPE